jgi:hypothetical protein
MNSRFVFPNPNIQKQVCFGCIRGAGVRAHIRDILQIRPNSAQPNNRQDHLVVQPKSLVHPCGLQTQYHKQPGRDHHLPNGHTIRHTDNKS